MVWGASGFGPWAEQGDLGLAITEDVDVRRLVIVGEDDHAQAVGTQHGDHEGT